MYIFLDESGDLGFDFKNFHPSRFFVITLLTVRDSRAVKQINKSVTKTLQNKLNKRKGKTRVIYELKGNATTIDVKKYFLKHMKIFEDWAIYTIILDKLSLLQHIKTKIYKDRIYNQMTHQILEYIDFSSIKNINLIVDRCKNDFGIREFNDFLYTNLNLNLSLKTSLYISHEDSEKHKGLQAVDMFCYGVARKYEIRDYTWYNLFKRYISVECKFKA